MGLFDRSSSTNQTDNSIDDDSNTLGMGAEQNNGVLADDSTLSNISGMARVNVLDGGAISEAFDFADSSGRNAMATLSGGINKLFKFTGKSQDTLIDAISETTKEQSDMYSQSLESVVSQGSSDIIKMVMLGLVGFGLVFALLR